MTCFVLVHGGWCTGWIWQGVAERLRTRGEQAVVVEQLPSGGHDPASLGDLAADARHLREIVATAPDDVVLVGHSYGGMVVTELADHPRVRHSVYVTAFLPKAGESLMDIRSAHEREWVIYRDDGVLHVTDDVATAHYMMGADLDERRFTEFYGTRVLQSAVSFGSPSTAPPRTHPVTYVQCAQDRAIVPADQERMAAAADHVHRIDAAHLVPLSQPDEVADVLCAVPRMTSA